MECDFVGLTRIFFETALLLCVSNAYYGLRDATSHRWLLLS